ncbi:MAG: CehA/McbA family metallohydrolase [Steroidobacteraceae bacterium]
MTRTARAFLALLPLLAPAPAQAAREAVLSQVKLPHTYYWRELYIPQLTTGPSAAAFMPAGDELVYSMGGSLWRQRIGSDEAVELTHAYAAYDYQPDVARDGKRVVFTRYDGHAMELWQLDLATGEARALTENGGVNLEPRISPDGRQIVFVSTAGSGHFNLKIAELTAAGLANERFLVQPRESAIDRYYYSTHDHAINPSWTPDGTRVYYVGNAEIPWGTGAICSIAVADRKTGCTTRHRVETSWAARPDVAPDGKRILFSNYHGGQWHQLWLTTTADAAPLPLTYGDFDRRNARWSPDGKRIAYISNEGGNTALSVQEFAGGSRIAIAPQLFRKRLRPSADVTLAIVDGAGRPASARVSILGSDARWHAPQDAWMHADEAYDRAQFPSETHYFHCASPCRVELPAGKATIRAQSGFRRLHVERTQEFAPGTMVEVPIRLEDNDLPADFGQFVSADLHVHMNYGGHYRNTPGRLHWQAAAEDLDVVHNLIVNKEERIPDVGYFRTDADPDFASGERALFHAQEYHTSFWGHLGLLHLSDHLLLPDYAAYRHTAFESPWPHNGVIADLAHAQGALVGYVHIADFPIDPPKEKSLSYQLPADVSHGKIDYLEVMGFSDHHITAGIWYRLLNLGFRLPAGAGTDAMANYASLRGPVGLVRVFLDTGGARTPEALHDALKSGKSFVSNSALLGLEIGGLKPGDSIPRVPGRFPLRVSMRSPVAMDHLELVQNGKVIRRFDLKGDRRRYDSTGTIELKKAGWVLLRAWNDAAHPDVLDLYPYATTSPIYIDLTAVPQAPDDAAYFLAWMDRVIQAARTRGDWNDEGERTATLEYLSAAREKYRALATDRRAN